MLWKQERWQNCSYIQSFKYLVWWLERWLARHQTLGHEVNVYIDSDKADFQLSNLHDLFPGRKISSIGISTSVLEDPILGTGSLEGQGELVLEVSAESKSRNSSCFWYKVAPLGYCCGDAAVCYTPQTDGSCEVSIHLLLHSELVLPKCPGFSSSSWQSIPGKAVWRSGPIALCWVWSWEKIYKYLTAQPILLGAGPEVLRLHALWISSLYRKTDISCHALEQYLPIFSNSNTLISFTVVMIKICFDKAMQGKKRVHFIMVGGQDRRIMRQLVLLHPHSEEGNNKYKYRVLNSLYPFLYSSGPCA
jgi:hypothetical protein